MCLRHAAERASRTSAVLTPQTSGTRYSLSTSGVLCASETGATFHRESVASQLPRSITSGRCLGAVQKYRQYPAALLFLQFEERGQNG